jgi:hypothetical protein
MPMISGEDPAEFESLRQDLINEYDPADGIESLLVDEIAQHCWRLRRAQRIETALTRELENRGEKAVEALNQIKRHMLQIERSRKAAIRTLRGIRADQRKAAKETAARRAAEAERLLREYVCTGKPN